MGSCAYRTASVSFEGIKLPSQLCGLHLYVSNSLVVVPLPPLFRKNAALQQVR